MKYKNAANNSELIESWTDSNELTLLFLVATSRNQAITLIAVLQPLIFDTAT